jgi:serine/threonine protein kinase
MERYESNLYDYVLLRRKKNLPFSNEEINSFIIQMITLLEALQRDNLAHRDIKPENILYNKGNYLLCDLDDMIEVNSN